MAARFTDENQRPFPMQGGSQLLHYDTSINRLFLEVDVSNTPSSGRPAEDAHNAILNVSIPPSLIYSGVRTKVVEVLITGKPLGHLGNLEVEFDWPRVVSSGKWLLYLAEIQVDGTSDPRCDPPAVMGGGAEAEWEESGGGGGAQEDSKEEESGGGAEEEGEESGGEEGAK
ncbi:hypothetical protein INR49_009486 [Caranx melampygus]|nr:hypothetical protein INR49_009486 [Caranx melampygus]